MGKKRKQKKRLDTLADEIASLRSRYTAQESRVAHIEFLLSATMAEVRTHIISKIDVEKLAEEERQIVAKWENLGRSTIEEERHPVISFEVGDISNRTIKPE